MSQVDFNQLVSEYSKRIELLGESGPDAVKAYRASMGIYQQRNGAFMARVRIPAGVIDYSSAIILARLSEEFANGSVHITTRQDVQLHDIAESALPALLSGLMTAGLYTAGGGGNTVRNVTACPYAGICPAEIFDVGPIAKQVSSFLLGQKRSYSLPRKFKIAFSGCQYDCALASVTDLGFFAQIQDGKPGFKVYAGGGLGANPAVAVQIENFIPVDRVFVVAQAVRNLFDQFGDRTDRAKARLRYVLGRLGEQAFVDEYKNQLSQTKEDSTCKTDEPEISNTQKGFPEGPVFQHKEEELHAVRLELAQGDIISKEFIGIAQLAESNGNSSLRLLQSQDILMTNIQSDRLDSVLAEIRSINPDMIEIEKPRIIACTGAEICKLGVCPSKRIAAQLQQMISQSPQRIRSGMTVRISGCRNSCASHFIADLGFQGRARQVNGKVQLGYDVFVGGSAHQGRTVFGSNIGWVSQDNLPQFVLRALALPSADKDELTRLLEKV